MVDEFAKRNAAASSAYPRNDLRASAYEPIHLNQPGVLDRVHDVARIANGACAGIFSVDEKRFLGRALPEEWVSSLHIDNVDIQSLRCSRLHFITGRCKFRRTANQEKRQKSDLSCAPTPPGIVERLQSRIQRVWDSVSVQA